MPVRCALHRKLSCVCHCFSRFRTIRSPVSEIGGHHECFSRIAKDPLHSGKRGDNHATLLCLCRSFMIGRGFVFFVPSGEGVEGGFVVV